MQDDSRRFIYSASQTYTVVQLQQLEQRLDIHKRKSKARSLACWLHVWFPWYIGSQVIVSKDALFVTPAAGHNGKSSFSFWFVTSVCWQFWEGICLLTFLGRVVSLAYNLVSEAVFGFITKKNFLSGSFTWRCMVWNIRCNTLIDDLCITSC